MSSQAAQNVHSFIRQMNDEGQHVSKSQRQFLLNNNNHQQILNAYYVLSMVLSILYRFSYLMLASKNYRKNFTFIILKVHMWRNWGTERLNDLLRTTEAVYSRKTLQTQGGQLLNLILLLTAILCGLTFKLITTRKNLC